jgi:hypothetical protein
VRGFGVIAASVLLLIAAATHSRERVAAVAVCCPPPARIAAPDRFVDSPRGLSAGDDIAAMPNLAPSAPPRLSSESVNATFYEWARREPEDALAAATQFGDDATRELAIQSALSGWARTDPAALADTALAFPDGEEKTAALTKAFRAWMIQDPKLAGDWIQAHPAQLAIAESVFRNENR